MTRGFSLLAAAGLALLVPASMARADGAVAIPKSKVDVGGVKGLQSAVFAGGCFWGMEAVFEQVKGVRSVTTGYAGGSRADATYDRVSTERTGHAESIRITYDPAQVSYATLLRIFFSVAHDPTELNRQTPDVGPSYRSAIFPQNEPQRRVAGAYIGQLNAAHAFAKPIATKIQTGTFYPAEAYHQDFARRNPSHPYIVRWDKPKVAAFRAAYPALAR
ncbi:peptide-methionine (S)-S-oxide reductase MsrA [Sphingomonas rustica]